MESHWRISDGAMQCVGDFVGARDMTLVRVRIGMENNMEEALCLIVYNRVRHHRILQRDQVQRTGMTGETHSVFTILLIVIVPQVRYLIGSAS